MMAKLSVIRSSQNLKFSLKNSCCKRKGCVNKSTSLECDGNCAQHIVAWGNTARQQSHSDIQSRTKCTAIHDYSSFSKLIKQWLGCTCGGEMTSLLPRRVQHGLTTASAHLAHLDYVIYDEAETSVCILMYICHPANLLFYCQHKAIRYLITFIL